MSQKQKKVKNQIVHNSKCRLFEIKGRSEFSKLAYGFNFGALLFDLEGLVCYVMFSLLDLDLFGLFEILFIFEIVFIFEVVFICEVIFN